MFSAAWETPSVAAPTLTSHAIVLHVLTNFALIFNHIACLEPAALSIDTAKRSIRQLGLWEASAKCS
jgi:hypothetical protein